MPYYLLALIILAFAIYVGVIGLKFSATVEEEQAIRTELVRLTLVKLTMLGVVLGIFMDLPFKTYGLFTVLNTALITGGFLWSIKLKKEQFRKEKDG